MEACTSFAAVYDTFMDNIPYEEWEKYLKSLLYEYGVREGLVLELGCGNREYDRDSGTIRLRYDRGGQCRRDA